MVPSAAQILIRRTSPTRRRSRTVRSSWSMAAASPSTRPAGIAGWATERPSTWVMARASETASSSAASRLRAPVARTTTTSVTNPAARNCATGFVNQRMGCAPPERARSEVDHTSAHLAVTHGLEHHRVGSGEVDDHALDLEGAAPGRRGGRAAVADRAVVADGPAPLLAGDVAVDLALDLEAAVVGLDLELPAGAGAAAAGADDPGVATAAAGAAVVVARRVVAAAAGAAVVVTRRVVAAAGAAAV